MSEPKKIQNNLYDALVGNSPYKPKPFLKFATKRNKHSARLQERIQGNALIIDKMIDRLKALNKIQGTEDEVEKLIEITRELLVNNAKLKEQVEEALQDIND